MLVLKYFAFERIAESNSSATYFTVILYFICAKNNAIKNVIGKDFVVHFYFM